MRSWTALETLDFLEICNLAVSENTISPFTISTALETALENIKESLLFVRQIRAALEKIWHLGKHEFSSAVRSFAQTVEIH